jgi:hypothetical protein
LLSDEYNFSHLKHLRAAYFAAPWTLPPRAAAPLPPTKMPPSHHFFTDFQAFFYVGDIFMILQNAVSPLDYTASNDWMIYE